MAIIMRSSGQKRDQEDKKKQIYTWVGCGLVAVLTLVSVIPNMGSDPKAPDYSKFSSSKMADLAALPFGTDAEAGSFLRGNPEYAGVASNAELLSSLFSSEDRKERQAADKAEGVPPPPDPQYQEIARDKEKAEENKRIKEARIEKLNKEKERIQRERERIANKKTGKKTGQQVRNQNTTTKPGTLGSSGRIGGGGAAGAGTTGSIWRYEGKDIKTGQGMPGSHALTAQDVAFAKDKGRNVGLDVAAIKSMKGANEVNAEKAAQNAIEAFQGETLVSPEELAEDEQELGLEELPEGMSEEMQDDLKRELGDEINKQVSEQNKSSNTANGKEYSVNEHCMGSDGKFNWGCFWGQAATWAVKGAIQIGISYATGGAGGGAGSSGGSTFDAGWFDYSNSLG